MMNLVKKFVREEEGAAMVEYAIIIGIIAVGVVAIVASIGAWVHGRFETLDGELTDATTPTTP